MECNSHAVGLFHDFEPPTFYKIANWVFKINRITSSYKIHVCD